MAHPVEWLPWISQLTLLPFIRLMMFNVRDASKQNCSSSFSRVHHTSAKNKQREKLNRRLQGIESFPPTTTTCEERHEICLNCVYLSSFFSLSFKTVCQRKSDFFNDNKTSEFTITNKSASNRNFSLKIIHKKLNDKNFIKSWSLTRVSEFLIKCHSFCRPVRILRYFFKSKEKTKREEGLSDSIRDILPVSKSFGNF